MTRRGFLGIGSGITLGTLAGAWAFPIQARADTDAANESFGFRRYKDLLAAIRERGHKLRVLGYAPDRSPVVAVKTGGDRKPTIFISAGSHSTEHAGVVAAVELIDELETEHEVYVLPCRDPIGLNGYPYVLSLSLGHEPSLASVEEAESLIREKGEVLYDRDGRLLVLIGEYGYATRSFYRKVEKGAAFLEPLKGRRLFWPSHSTDQPGAAPLERAYTQIVSPEGEVLHVNRFHDTPWAPVEVRCTRRLMAEIQPRLTFDLHEYGGEAFWMSARRQQTDADERWELRMAKEAAQAVGEAGGDFPDEDYLPGSFFKKIRPGVFWLKPAERGEGLNLIDFAAHQYGPGFTIETGMRQEFGHRLHLQKTVVQAAVQVFEERYAG